MTAILGNVVKNKTNVAPAAGALAAASARAVPASVPGGYAGMDTAGMGKQIDSIYDGRMASEMQKLQAAKDAALQGYNQQETLAKQTGYDNRNAADVVNMQNVNALKEQMAANGLSSSGDNITASGNLASARLGAINDINRTQGNALQDIAQKRALTISQEAANELALTQQINADRAQAKLDLSGRADDRAYQMSRDKAGDAYNTANITGYYQSPEMQQQYSIVNQAKQDYADAKTPQERLAAHQRAEAARALITQMGGNAGLVGSGVTAQQAGMNKGQYGVETLAHQQQMYNQDPNNPNNQAQIISNKINQLNLDNLPEQIKLGLKQLKQQVAAGEIDMKTAEYNLKELTDPNSITNKRNKLALQLDQMNVSNTSTQNKLEVEKLKKTIANIGKTPPKSDYEEKMNQIKLETAQVKLDQLKNGKPDSGGSDGTPAKISAKESTDNLRSIIGELDGGNPTRVEAEQVLKGNADYLSDADYKALAKWIDDNT